MAYYDNEFELERATPYPIGGCLSGFILLTFTVIVSSLILVSSLINIGTPPSVTLPNKGIGGSPETFISPYDSYTLTQGPHGYSYGHMAIDIAAGKGSKIFSPIHGEVSDFFIDGIGNPTLIIENDIYRIIMMHGVYSVQIGDRSQSRTNRRHRKQSWKYHRYARAILSQPKLRLSHSPKCIRQTNWC